MKSKKTVMLISQSLTGGGAEKVVANLSLELEKKCTVILVTYEKNEKEFIFSGIRVNIDIPGCASGFISKLVTAGRRILKLKKLKKQYMVDFSISFVPQTDYANVFSKVKGCKNIIEVSSNSSYAFSSGIFRFIRRIILKAADKVVAVSEGSREDIIENFGIIRDKTAVIYNSCDIEAINRSSINEKNDFGSKYIISVGSFRYPKGHWHLIKAFSYIANEIPDYNLVILGDGEYRPKYIELIKNLKLNEKRIFMPGFIRDPYSIIKKANLFLFTSVFEGFGNVIIEAMACGVPVLSVDCDFGPKEILEPTMDVNEKIKSFYQAEYGWMLPAFSKGDIDTTNSISEEDKLLGKTIVDCLKNEKKWTEYQEKGYVRCLDFSTTKIVDRWIEVLFDDKK